MPDTLSHAAATLQQLNAFHSSPLSFASNFCEQLHSILPVQGVQVCRPAENEICHASSGKVLTSDMLSKGEGDLWQWFSLMTRQTGFKLLPADMLTQAGSKIFACRLANSKDDSASLLLYCDPDSPMTHRDSELRMFSAVLQNFWRLQHAEMSAKQARKTIDKQYGKVLRQLQDETQKHQAMERVATGLAELAACRTEFELLKKSVELIHGELGIDRAAAFIIDNRDECYHGVYGIDPTGSFIDERRDAYGYDQLADPFIEALSNTSTIIHVEKDITLYHKEQPAGFGWNAMVVLRHEDQALGWFAMDNLISHEAYQEHLNEALTIFAKTIARFLVEIRHNSRVRLLSKALGLMSSARTTIEVCKIAVEFTVEHLDIDRVGIFLQDGDLLRGTYGVDTDGNVIDETGFSMPKPNTQLADMAFLNPNELIVLDSVPLYQERRKVGIGWNACIVVAINGEVVVMICADNLVRHRLLTNQQKELFQLFCYNVGEVVSRIASQESLLQVNASLEERIAERTRELELLNQQLELTARQDMLTGLKNRRAYEEAIEEEWYRHKRNQTFLTLALFDLDGFKEVNDVYGHLAGDEVLQTFSGRLKESFGRSSDIVARLGGDEFAVIIGQQNPDESHRLLRKFCSDFPQYLDRKFAMVTVSIGIVSTIPNDNQNPDSIFSLADDWLYKAKENGKNQALGEVLVKGE